MLIDQCQFLSDETPLLAVNRVSITLNTNGNDVKIRDCRSTHFRHFAVIGGSSSIITGNHFFQGDSQEGSPRTAGLVLMRSNNRGTIMGNYIDNAFIEWTNEQDAAPEFSSEFSFSALSVSDNVMLASDVASWFTYLVVRPYGPGHFVNGLSVTGNSFRIIGDNVVRVEGVDSSFATLDYSRFGNITFDSNSFGNVDTLVASPLVVDHVEGSAAKTWVVDTEGHLPFGAWARAVNTVVPMGAVRTAGNQAHHGQPYVLTEQGANKDQIHLVWEVPVKGRVMVHVRGDQAV